MGDDDEGEDRQMASSGHGAGDEASSSGPTLIEEWERERCELEASKVRFLRVVKDQRQVEETVQALLEKLVQLPEEVPAESKEERPQWTPSANAGDPSSKTLVESRIAVLEERSKALSDKLELEQVKAQTGGPQGLTALFVDTAAAKEQEDAGAAEPGTPSTMPPHESGGSLPWPEASLPSPTGSSTPASTSGWVPGSSWAPLRKESLSMSATDSSGGLLPCFGGMGDESAEGQDMSISYDGRTSEPVEAWCPPSNDTWRGWDMQTTANGELFFFHRKRGISQWESPAELADVLGCWEQVPGINGGPDYWCNNLLQLSTWHDPRSIATVFQAAFVGDLFFLDLYIKARGDVNLLDSSGRTALHLAASSAAGEAEQIVSVLLAGGANINARDVEGCSPLHYAARCKRPAVVRKLLAAGADSAGQNASGDVATHLAVEAHSVVTLAALLEYQADITSRSHSRGMRTPLELAVAQGTQDLAALLRKAAHAVPKRALSPTAAMLRPTPPQVGGLLPSPRTAAAEKVEAAAIAGTLPRCDVAAWRRASHSMSAIDSKFLAARSKVDPEEGLAGVLSNDLEDGELSPSDPQEKTERTLVRLLQRLRAIQLRRENCSRSRAYELGHGVPFGESESTSISKLLGLVANLPSSWRPILEPIFLGLRVGMEPSKASDDNSGLP